MTNLSTVCTGELKIKTKTISMPDYLNQTIIKIR